MSRKPRGAANSKAYEQIPKSPLEIL